MESKVSRLLAGARRLASTGQDDNAKAEYLALLRLDPTNFSALNELGALALASGHRSAAQSAYRQAVQCHPGNPVGRVNLGNLYLLQQEPAAAREQYQAALAIDSEFFEAHQGLGRALAELGELEAAEAHFTKGFGSRSIVIEPYRGASVPIPVLLLLSVRWGNVAVRSILDARVFQVAAVYTEFYNPDLPLPPHAAVFNAIGDADLCALALERAQQVLERTSAPVINLPSAVRRTGRIENAQRLASLPGVIAPTTRLISRADLQRTPNLEFPLLLRSPGFHMGKHFLRIERREELAGALAALPGAEVLAIECLDARGADGMARKYRVMFIDGVLYPLHLAISSNWKIHYFSAEMATHERYREEERRFLEDMPAALGARALAALDSIRKCLRLDYAGVDFAVDDSGLVLLFEANATMAILEPPPDPIWDYRRAAIGRALEAAKQLVAARARAGLIATGLPDSSGATPPTMR